MKNKLICWVLGCRFEEPDDDAKMCCVRCGCYSREMTEVFRTLVEIGKRMLNEGR